MIATYGRSRNPSFKLKEKDRRIHANAQAGQKTLYLLDANIAANIHHQIHVSNPCKGVAQDATASDMDNGMLIIETESPAFQFDFQSEMNFFFIKFICRK